MHISVQWRHRSVPTYDPNSLRGIWSGSKTIKSSLVLGGVGPFVLGLVRLCLTTRLWGVAVILMSLGVLSTVIGWFVLRVESPGAGTGMD